MACTRPEGIFVERLKHHSTVYPLPESGIQIGQLSIGDLSSGPSAKELLAVVGSPQMLMQVKPRIRLRPQRSVNIKDGDDRVT